MDALRASFRPEFINRIDEIVIFNPLGKEQLTRIVDLMLRDVEKLFGRTKNLRWSLLPRRKSCCCVKATIPPTGLVLFAARFSA